MPDICKTLWQIFEGTVSFLSAVVDVATEEDKGALVTPQFNAFREQMDHEACKWYRIHRCDSEIKLKHCQDPSMKRMVLKSPKQVLDEIEKGFWEREEREDTTISPSIA